MKSVISASSTPATTPSPIEAALPVIWAFVWMLPPPSLSAKVTVALAYPCPPASRDLIVSTARWSASSFSVTSTVPVNFIDIAPILTRISAFTASGPVRLEHAAALDGRHDPLEVE